MGGKERNRKDDLIEAAVDMRLRKAQDADELAFMGRPLVQMTLPHSNPGNVQFYERTNGDVSLVVQPGFVREDGELKSAGIPYGSYPRLVLAWVTTEATRTKSRELVLGGSLSAFMGELGLIPSGGRWGTIHRLRDQMRRLFSARIAVVRGDAGSFEHAGIQIANRAKLWWDPKRPNEPVLFNSTVQLGEDFFRMVTERPVPIDMRALRALKQSPLGLDLYMWLTYRVSYLKGEQAITWKQLHEQFGAEYAQRRNFVQKVKRELEKIESFWPGLRYETPRGRLVLQPSPTHVSRLKSKSKGDSGS